MKKDKREKKLYTLDTETRGLFGKVFRVGLYTEEMEIERYLANDEFMPIFEEVKETQEYDIHVYVHNLDFDLAKIATDLFNDVKIDFGSSIFINGKVACLKTNYCTFHDSYLLLASSLEKLCKDFEIGEDSKLDITDYIKENGYAIYDENGKYLSEESKGNFFMNVPSDDLLLNDYLYHDCKSLYKLIMKLCDLSMIPLEQIIYCPTGPSLAMTVFKTRFPEDYKEMCSTKFVGEWGNFIESFFREAYCGGRVEVFIPYMCNGWHYDINSLFPYGMKTFLFPVGVPKYLRSKDIKTYYEFWKFSQKGGGFIHCKVYVPDMHIPPLPKHDKSGKLLFPVGRLYGVWTFPELYEAEKLGCIIEEYEQGIYFDKMKPIFKEYIEYFEEIKTHSEGAKRQFAKDMSNLLYGKTGMQRVRTTFVNMDQYEKVREKGDPFTIHRHTQNMINVEFIECLFRSRAEYIQPHIAAYVTSYARIILLRGLLIHGGNDAAYCDTDSKATNMEMPEDMVHDYEYGKWKLEGTFEEAVFLQPKFYAEKGKVLKKGVWQDHQTIKAKGIPKEVMRDYNFNSYLNWLEIMKAGEQNCIHLYDNVLARRKFISALKNNDDFDKPTIRKKTINLLMEQKRDIDYVNNCSKPHTRIDYGEGADDSREHVFDQYKEIMFKHYDDVDIIKEHVKRYGYIRRLEEGDTFYNRYSNLSKRVIARYFRVNQGLPIIAWCELSGWQMTALFEELEGME